MSQAAAAPAYSRPRRAAATVVTLDRLRRIGYAALALQFAGFAVWSSILYSRFALTYDFAINNQAWFMIAHGHLDPYSLEGIPYWQDHSAILMWPLALLYWVWPHGVTLLWLQDACVAGAELVAFTWLCERARRQPNGTDAAWLAAAGLVLLVANPWIWWAVSFDFHIEGIALLFAVLLARDLEAGRRRAWAWVAPLLACGDVAGTYLAAVGLGSVLAGRRAWRPGVVMACLGLAATLAITLVHGDRGSGQSFHTYAYLFSSGPVSAPLTLAALAQGLVTHPLRVLHTLWIKRVDIWASLAPAGLVGLGYLPLLPIIGLVMLENTLFHGLRFTEPIFQYLPVYVFLPTATVAVLGWLLRRHRLPALLLAALLVVQTVGWAVVWAPRTPAQWLRVPASTAAVLAGVAARIPASAEVVASQGIAGRFSGRAVVHTLSSPGSVPVRSGADVWFVVVPWAGIEIQSPASAMALIGELAGPLHATLVTHSDGVWAFRWRPPAGTGAVEVPGGATPLPAWAVGPVAGTIGRPVLAGPVSAWRVAARGRGYAADELAWQKPPGRYEALVTLSAAGPVNVEVWNDTSNMLLARHYIPGTTGVESVSLSVDAAVGYRARAYSGWGPFRAFFVPPASGERLEVRVWSPGGRPVSVYSAELIAAPRAAGGP